MVMDKYVQLLGVNLFKGNKVSLENRLMWK